MKSLKTRYIIAAVVVAVSVFITPLCFSVARQRTVSVFLAGEHLVIPAGLAAAVLIVTIADVIDILRKGKEREACGTDANDAEKP